MVIKTYNYTHEQVAKMDFDELERAFSLGEDDVIFALSPESLRTICENSHRAKNMLCDKLCMRAARGADDDTVHLDRIGYIRAMTDKAFVAKLAQIVKNELVGPSVPEDEDEAGYAEYAALKSARLKRQIAKQELARAALAEKSKSALEEKETEDKKSTFPEDHEREPLAKSAAETSRDDDSDKESKLDEDTESPPVFMKAKFFSGQLNVSHLISGSRILTFGTGKRQSWSANSPLVVSRISGITANTTTIEYIGEELRPADVEMHAAIMFLCANAKDEEGEPIPLGRDLNITERALLKALQREDGGAAYLALREQITRLQNSKLIITTTYGRLIQAIAAAMPEDSAAQAALQSQKLRLTVSLLGDSTSSATDKQAGILSLTIPRRLRALFGKGLSSWCRSQDYYRLKNQSAKRLFLLYVRHADPLPFTLGDLREFLGSQAGTDDSLRKSINAAHRHMHEQGVLASVPKYKEQAQRLGVKGYKVKLRQPQPLKDD